MGTTDPDLAKTLAEDRLPERFGRYRIVKRLGQGGMGSVYLAHDTQLDRPVALKVPRFGGDVSPSFLQRFQTEARAAATLHHPNLCPVYDVGETGGRHYLTMAYIEGRALSAFAQRWSVRDAAVVIRKLALALQEAHAKGVIHRDLKPSNIMINHRAEPVIMDFGLARRSTGDARLTQEGTVLGTPAYMAPEQVQGDVAAMGPGCDIYSLGVILYELLAGQPPFEGSPMSVLAQIMTQEPAPPSKHRPDLDPRLEAICLKAMAKRTADRYPNMAAFAAALTDCLRSGRSGATATLAEETAVRPPVDQAAATQAFDKYPTRPDSGTAPTAWETGKGHSRKGWLLAAGLAAAALLLGTVVVLVFMNRNGQTPGGDSSAAGPAPAPTPKPAEEPPAGNGVVATTAEYALPAPLTSRKAANRPYGPEQVTGEPDGWPKSGDLTTAWASLTEDGGPEWLLLEYPEAVEAASLEIYETYNPGAVHRVTVFKPDGTEVEAWKGQDPTPAEQEKGISPIPLQTTFKVKFVKVHLASRHVAGWNEIDAVGLIDRAGKTHWPIAAAASSTYATNDDESKILFSKLRSAALASPSWSAMQATGEPDTWPNFGDRGTAWASKTPDDQDEWLLLEYAEPILPSAVHVYETFNPGAVATVTVFTAAGKEVVAWTGLDPTEAGSEKGISKIELKVNFKVSRVKLYLESKRVPGWNEIDAVGLIDARGKPHWPVSAKASSSYADP